jgi:hypothetical protein
MGDAGERRHLALEAIDVRPEWRDPVFRKGFLDEPKLGASHVRRREIDAAVHEE